MLSLNLCQANSMTGCFLGFPQWLHANYGLQSSYDLESSFKTLTHSSILFKFVSIMLLISWLSIIKYPKNQSTMRLTIDDHRFNLINAI
jgi:hypothetical protein